MSSEWITVKRRVNRHRHRNGDLHNGCRSEIFNTSLKSRIADIESYNNEYMQCTTLERQCRINKLLKSIRSKQIKFNESQWKNAFIQTLHRYVEKNICIYGRLQLDTHVDIDGNVNIMIRKRSINYDLICYGIGSISSHYHEPQYQLACYLSIIQHIRYTYKHSNSHINTYIYDPLFNMLDKDICGELDIDVLKKNNEGKYSIDDNDDDRQYIFYMPHCPMMLYSNLIRHTIVNNPSSIHRIMIIGNNLSSYADRSMVSIDNGLHSKDIRKHRRMNDVDMYRILYANKCIDSSDIGHTFHICPNAFNDTTIHRLLHFTIKFSMQNQNVKNNNGHNYHHNKKSDIASYSGIEVDTQSHDATYEEVNSDHDVVEYDTELITASLIR